MKNLAKRLCALALCVLVCAVSALTVAAASETVKIKECDNLELKLPDNMSYVTRFSQTNDRYFSRHKLSYSDVMRDFEESNGYLHAMDDNDEIILTLSYSETPYSKEMDSYSKYSAAQLEEIKQNTISTSKASTIYHTGTADEASNGLAWLFFNITTENTRQYRAETVNNGKIITLTLFRNGGDVKPEDYSILKGITSTVSFPKNSDGNSKMWMIYVGIGAAAVALILIIVLVIVVKKGKKRKMKNDNDKILKELADKHKTRRAPVYEDVEPVKKPADDYSDDFSDSYSDDSYSEERPAAVEEPVYEEKHARRMAPEETERPAGRSYTPKSYDIDVPDRKYSDEDIERLLGDLGDDENFNVALPATEADSEDNEEVRDSVIQKADAISDFFEDEPENEEAPQNPAAEESAASAYAQKEAWEAPEMNVEQISEDEDVQPEEAPYAPPQEDFDEEPEDDFEEEPEEEAEEPDESDDSEDEEEPGDEPEPESDEEFEEFVNDEVLAREESDQGKFKSSNDFFDEAPRRVIGVISSQEIEEAEEYDVIGEVEHRAEQIEQEPEYEGERFSETMKKVGSGLKNFGTHCGYFATNVKRSIKRRRAINKRKKAEEERRQKQIERRRQQRAAQERRRDSNGLVQVHSRDDRRPPSGSRPRGDQ